MIGVIFNFFLVADLLLTVDKNKFSMTDKYIFLWNCKKFSLKSLSEKFQWVLLILKIKCVIIFLQCFNLISAVTIFVVYCYFNFNTYERFFMSKKEKLREQKEKQDKLMKEMELQVTA